MREGDATFILPGDLSDHRLSRVTRRDCSDFSACCGLGNAELVRVGRERERPGEREWMGWREKAIEEGGAGAMAS
jgi:hypothetical protein